MIVQLFKRITFWRIFEYIFVAKRTKLAYIHIQNLIKKANFLFYIKAKYLLKQMVKFAFTTNIPNAAVLKNLPLSVKNRMQFSKIVIYPKNGKRFSLRNRFISPPCHICFFTFWKWVRKLRVCWPEGFRTVLKRWQHLWNYPLKQLISTYYKIWRITGIDTLLKLSWSSIINVKRKFKVARFHVTNISGRKRYCHQYEIIKIPAFEGNEVLRNRWKHSQKRCRWMEPQSIVNSWGQTVEVLRDEVITFLAWKC